MAAQRSFIQACAVAILMHVAAAQVYDTSLNLNRWQEDVLVFKSSQSAESNTSQILPNSTNTQLYIKGFLSLGLSIIGLGTSLVPIKHTETGDGLFFQLVFCSAMWLESLTVHFIQGSSQTWLLSILAGSLFGIANLTTIPIIRTIGLGLGFLIRSTFCLLMGWASGRFGWFGLDPQDVVRPVLNYIGTALAAVSVLILVFIKTEGDTDSEPAEDTESLFQNEPDQSHDNKLDLVDECILAEPKEEAWEDKLSPLQRKIIGCSLATCAGTLYGCCYTPIIYVKNRAMRNSTYFSGASQYDLDYIFPFMTGVSATTTFAFFVYCAVMKNRPHLPPKCVIPAFVSGSLQFGSQIAWFLSSYYLGTVITYPIGTAGPTLVSLGWSVFVFKEIKGIKNFALLGVVLVAVLAGITLITVSKIN